jgi:MraZ protein
MMRMANLAFSGSFDHSLDGKGRVIIPASFREALGENFTITINPNKTAVAIYPKEMWDQQLERLSQINPMDRVGMQYERYVMSVSFSGNSMDAQGRVLIPAKLRAKIGLARDIVFVGLNRYIEIWDAEVYAKMEEQTEEDFESLSDYVYQKYPI